MFEVIAVSNEQSINNCIEKNKMYENYKDNGEIRMEEDK